MKKLFSLITILIFFASCGDKAESVDAVLNSGNLSEIKAKRNELNEKQRQLKADIDRLDEYIHSHEREDRPILITAQVAETTTFKHYIEVQGNVDTDQNLVLNGEFSGVLTNVYVKEGQQVSKGQLLAKIEDGGLSSQVAQQETQLALAQTTFERQERLWNQKIGSEIQYLQSKTNYESAKNAVDQLRSQLSKTEIRAPFSGVIDDVMSDPGQLIVPGQTPVIRIVNLSDMYVKASIPENYLRSVKKGSQVIVNLVSIDKEFTGIVRQVSNYINPANRSFEIEVAIPNDEGLVKPNLIATVRVNDYQVDDAIVIPENILHENSAGEQIIYTYKPVNDSIGEAKRRVVETGKSYKNKVEILKGISAGDTVIIEGSKNLREGQKVIIKN